jgi:SAM-dependent methyltransferase
MPRRDWNDDYAQPEPPPWDDGAPDPILVAFLDAGLVAPGRALDVGAGTGTNALFLAERGFEVVGVDISPLAVEQADAKAKGRCRFLVHDFLAGPVPHTPFDFVFDRGCFHVFDEAEERARFAALVASALAPGGLWLSLIGSTEGPPRDVGPPRRSARDVMEAIEPALEIVELRAGEFRVRGEPAQMGSCLSRLRTVPAQASSRHA